MRIAKTGYFQEEKSGEHLDETKTICSIQGFSISRIYSGLELDQETGGWQVHYEEAK